MTANAEIVTYRLSEGCVNCDVNGLRLSNINILRRRESGRPQAFYELPPIGELEKNIAKAYGQRVDARGKLVGLQVVVDALNKGEIARAQVATLLLKFPDPMSSYGPALSLSKRLYAGGWL